PSRPRAVRVALPERPRAGCKPLSRYLIRLENRVGRDPALATSGRVSSLSVESPVGDVLSAHAATTNESAAIGMTLDRTAFLRLTLPSVVALFAKPGCLLGERSVNIRRKAHLRSVYL